MCIAATIIGGAVIGAAGTAIAGSEAASATRDASNAAISAQQQALAQQAALAKPYTDLGSSAMDQYKALLGLGPQGGAGVQSTLANLPGYQFTKQQGLDATTARASAMYGGGGGGNLLEAIDQYTTGLANQNYGQYLNELLQPIQIGQAAAAGQAANIQTGASNIGNIAIGQGQTMAGIDANTIAGITKAIGGGANNYLTYETLSNLNNPGSRFNPGNFGAPAGWFTGGQTGDLTYGQEVAAGF